MEPGDEQAISGGTAAEIAESVRTLVDRGILAPGDPLPPVRALAAQLGVHRNTAVAAYRTLARSGVVITEGRAGTHVASRARLPQEGFAGAPADPERDALRDLGSGNPDPALIPDLASALAAAVGRPVLYGEPVIDPDFEQWVRDWTAPDVPTGRDVRLTLTSGAVDAIERLLAQALVRGDAVALEDPCFLASIQTVRHGGYRALPVPVDAEGMTADGLRAALEAGARAVVITPRAQNPTGASLSAERAAALRDVLAEHPYVLVIEDDYYSFLSRAPFHSVVGPEHRRWALVRSVSKFLGPDLCLAVTATDPDTAERLALRLSSGTTWVSHLLQRLAHGVLQDAGALALIERAGAHYAERGGAFARALAAHGIEVRAGDGMSVWVPVGRPAQDAAAALARRGWRVRTGDDFRLAPGAEPSQHLRLTVHDLDDAELKQLATDLAAAGRA